MLRYRSPGIDLLPAGTQKQKRNRRLAIKLAAIQVAIFLCICVVVVGLRNLDARAQGESGQLLINISRLRYSHEVESAIRYRELDRHFTAEEEFFAINLHYTFDPIWLDTILEVARGSITSLDFDGIDIDITGIVYNFDEIESLRLSLSETNVFDVVGMGNIRSQGQGRFFYDFRLTPVGN
ncbi:MAG: hypothetical protein FWC73_00705 [Defluviitaleaceae bacterium]|nr:hypothetical protein [Defluviitaleaceae bacterium]